MSLRRAICTCGIGAAAVSALLAPAAAFGASVDYGDAPDGANAGYIKAPAVIGSFPSKAATPGPSASPSGLFLGAAATTEADSLQVNADPSDDGAAASLKACDASTVDLAVNAAGLPSINRDDPGDIAYVNIWFDWNRDGDWADTSDTCRPEWAVQNMPLRVDTAGPLGAGGIGVVPIGLTAGHAVDDIWMRVTITLKDPADATGGAIANPNGGGRPLSFTNGEVEDYLLGPAAKDGGILIPNPKHKPKKKKKKKKKKHRKHRKHKKKPKPFKVTCNPNPVVIPHGATATVKFGITNPGKGLIYGSTGALNTSAGKLTLIKRKPQPKGIPRGYVVVDGFNFKSTHVDPPTRVQTVSRAFRFSRGNQVQHLICKIVILHGEIGNIPKIICGGPCGGSLPVVPPLSGVQTSTKEVQTVPIEIVSLSLVSTAPVTFDGFSLRLDTPVVRTAIDPAVSSGGDIPRPVSCEIVPLDLVGGPPVLRCQTPPGAPAPLDSFFDILLGPEPGASLKGTVRLSGTDYDLDSVPFGGFTSSGSVGGSSPAATYNFMVGVPIRSFRLVSPGHTLSSPNAINPPGFNCVLEGGNQSFRCTHTTSIPAGTTVAGAFQDASLASGQSFQLFVRPLNSAHDYGPVILNTPP